jgi:hypothetical protein
MSHVCEQVESILMFVYGIVMCIFMMWACMLWYSFDLVVFFASIKRYSWNCVTQCPCSLSTPTRGVWLTKMGFILLVPRPSRLMTERSCPHRRRPYKMGWHGRLVQVQHVMAYAFWCGCTFLCDVHPDAWGEIDPGLALWNKIGEDWVHEQHCPTKRI